MSAEGQMITQTKRSKTASDGTRWISARKLLILIIIVAVILRLASAFYQGNQVTPLPGTWDQLSYDGMAQRVAAGYGFSFAEDHWPATRAGEPTAHWSYLYTLYLTAVYSTLGYQPLVARVIQALIAGVLQTWLTWRIGRRILGPTVGLLAAAFSAVYIYFFYYGGSLLTESFYFVGILWTLDVTMRITGNSRQTREEEFQQSDYWLWLELGLAIAVTVLLRQVFLLFLPFLFLWIWWTLPQPAGQQHTIYKALRWPTLKRIVIASLVLVLFILPWTIRNYRAFDTVVPLNTNAGFAFYWGNHPIHGDSFVPILPNDGPSYYDLIPPELLSLNEAELDQALLKEAKKIIVADPQRYLRLSLSRTTEYFKFWPSGESSVLSNLSRVGSFALFLPLMLYGLWLSLGLVRRPTHEGQRAEIALLYLFMGVYTAVHLATWTLIRYRLPVDAVLMIFAALGIEGIANQIIAWRGRFKFSHLLSG